MTASVGRAAVLGRPVAHSLSPVLHRAAYAALALDWRYDAIECGADELPGVLAARDGWAGFSCTMPLKRALLEVADSVDDDAVAIGAANTLLPLAGGGWHAANTDAPGLVAALAERGVHRGAAGEATIVGAGGTAQAAVAALRSLGVARMTALVREPARAATLCETAERFDLPVRVARLDDLAARATALGAELVVVTLPAGAADPLAAHAWRPDQTVLDVVYAPWPTTLAVAARSAGASVIGGAAMLLHQAARQVELMTGHSAPLDAMRDALDGALARPRAD